MAKRKKQMKNFTLNSNDEVHKIIKRPPQIRTPKALPFRRQEIFNELHSLSGEDYQKKLSELKTHWVRKVKLTSDEK